MRVNQRPPGVFLTVAILVLSTMIAGCTSLKRVNLPGTGSRSTFGPVKPGDTVSVVLRTGERVHFVVATVDDTSLASSDGVSYQRTDIVELRRRSTSVVKTSLLVAGVAVGTFLAIAAIAFATWDGPIFGAR